MRCRPGSHVKSAGPLNGSDRIAKGYALHKHSYLNSIATSFSVCGLGLRGAGLGPGPQATPSIWAPASTPAHEIYGLSLFVLLITGAIFAVVGGLLLFVIFKFRERKSDAEHEPAQIYGSVQVELAWTVIPVLIVVVLFLTTARIISAIQDAPGPRSALRAASSSRSSVRQNLALPVESLARALQHPACRMTERGLRGGRIPHHLHQ